MLQQNSDTERNNSDQALSRRQGSIPLSQLNPLIERLPPPENDHATALRLGFAPAPPDREFLSAPWYIRLDSLANRDEIHVALAHEIDAYRRILSIARRCLSHRHPADPRVQEHLYKLSQLSEPDWQSGRAIPILGRLIPSGGGALGYTIDGPTGIGKSSFSDRLFNAFDGDHPEIHHEINGRKCRLTQMKILRTSCTGEGLKDVCHNILQHADSILHTDYSRIGRKFTALWEYVSQVHRMATANYLGLLLIDDMQRLADFDAQTEKTLRLFANFMQATGIPIVILGTYRVRKVLGSPDHLQEGSKLMGLGHQTFERLSCDKEWGRLNVALWNYRVSHPDLAMPDWLPILTHWYAQGIPRYLRFIMDEFFRRMVKQENSTVDKEMLKVSAETALIPYQKPLNVMREVAVGAKLDGKSAALYEHLLATTPIKAKAMPANYPEQEERAELDFLSKRTRDESTTTEKPTQRTSQTATSKSTAGTRNSKAKGKGKTAANEQSREIQSVIDADDPRQEATARGWNDDFEL